MNKAYRVIRCAKTGQSVVVSELAKGHSEISTKTSVIKSGSHILISHLTPKFAGTVAMSVLGVSSAWATCTGANTSPNFSGNYTEITVCADEPVVDINNANFTVDNSLAAYNGAAAISVTQSAATGNPVRMNVDGITINSNKGTGTATLGMGIKASVFDDLSINFAGNNSINVDENNGTSVLAHSISGNATIDITGTFNLHSGGVGSTALRESDGLEVTSLLGSTIKHTGAGVIDVSGGNAVFGRVRGATGDVAITLKGSGGANSIELITRGNTSTLLPTYADGQYGISASIDDVNNATGKIIIDTDAKINTFGSNSSAIKAYSQGGSITITNAGDLNTSGYSAKGIYAQQSLPSGTGIMGKVTINNTGNIHTTNNGVNNPNTGAGNAGAPAIYAVISSANHSEGIEINQAGSTISTSGYDSHGILALSRAISGDINVTVTDTIIDVKSHNSDAIDVQRLTSGNINEISDVNINIATNGGEFRLLDGASSLTGGANFGIVAHQYDAAKGNINIINNGTKITTGVGANGLAPNSDAINATFINNTATGNIFIANGGELTTLSDKANTIKAVNAGAGKIDIVNEGNLSVSGNDSSAITATSTGAGNIQIYHKNGAVITSTGNTVTGSRTDAINGFKSSTATGDITIFVDGDISTEATNRGAGAYAQHQGAGNATVIGTGNITASASFTGTNIYSYGLAATVSDSVNAGGNATVGYSQGTIRTSGEKAYALYAGVVGNYGDAVVENRGTLITTGNNSHGIWSRNDTTAPGNQTSGNAIALNSGGIQTTGEGSHGIYANSNHNVYAENTGNITTSSANTMNGSHGILAEINATKTGNVTAINSGTINIQGSGSKGILVRASGGTNNILNTGTIKHTANTAYQYGIEALGGDSTTHIIENNGEIAGGNFGIVAWNGANAHTGGKSRITIGSQGSVDANNGITADMSDENIIDIHQGGRVNARNTALLLRGYGLAPTIAEDTVNNSGSITSDQDIILKQEFSTAGATVNFNNDFSGEMTGGFKVAAGKHATNTTLNNSGTWNLRQFVDTDGDRIRDEKQIAISDFGVGSNSSIINQESGVLNLSKVTGEMTTNDLGEYVPVGALSINNSDIVHGQLLNLATFENAGKIDLTQNAQAGDVLVISGSNTAGTYDPLAVNTFISNGGSIYLDSVLNEGGAISQSDVIVLDDVMVGVAGATKVRINAVGGNGALTEGDGIKIIEVLGQNDTNAFVGDGPITHGLYEYTLAMGTGANSNNWYLKNSAKSTSPVAGVYLNTQYAAGHMFTQNILDRRDAAWTPDSNIWARVNHSETKMDTMERTQKGNIKTTMIQIGGDVAHWNEQNTRLGIFGGYGYSDIDSKSKLTGSKASAKVNGYHVGIYGSWIPQENMGPFIDLWAQYAWFDNKLTGNAQHGKDIKYDSSAITLSAEVGHAFPMFESENKDWIIEPHAQVMYTFFDVDSFKDNNQTRFTDGKGDGFRSRLGARFYGMNKDKVGGSPFVETNWLHDNTDNEVTLIEQKKADAGGAKNIAEMKLGLEGHVTEDFSIWAHVGGQWGDKNYERYEGQLGLGYKWK